MGTPRLLLVHAHPDDESLWTGGLTARHVDDGGEADLVMCTWAEGTIRHQELTEAVDILGMPRPPIMLGYADDRRPESAPDAPRLCAASFDDQVRALTAHIRKLRPDIVVTYDALGIYGHPDHVHAHRLACAAADAAASTKLYHRAGPAWRVRSLYFATIPEWMMDMIAPSLFPEIPRDQLPGTPDSDIDVVVDVSDLAARKKAGVVAHRSEVDRSRAIAGFLSLPDDIQHKLLSVECYQRRDLVPGGCELV
ncbi:PIG-L family deacetylase [Gordonia sp. C13]|uniref:PIG-L family deacetylase n=1 Tax=Gordonia sp. C13 TaxID=2935078 RepID=UPI00200ADDF4|nr:PIG-L family deacetylase [Gordonia sp. C13]MCK8614215.1 PIG-L family deacetylase [Gordonia sp. C13]